MKGHMDAERSHALRTDRQITTQYTPHQDDKLYAGCIAGVFPVFHIDYHSKVKEVHSENLISKHPTATSHTKENFTLSEWLEFFLFCFSDYQSHKHNDIIKSQRTANHNYKI